MESYIDLFKKLDLPVNREDLQYQSAEQFAQEFKRCSVLENYNTFYSVDSIIETSSVTHTSQNLQSYSSINNK